MKRSQFPKEFIQAIPVIEKIKQAGFEAYFVGGSVRDYLLQKPIHDVDIATSAYPSEIKEIFPITIDVGIEHGTVLVLWQEEQYEVTTFRTESQYTDYRRPDTVSFVRNLEEDLKRRDFTINALALKTSGEIIDLFEGRKDLSEKRIRAVGRAEERFCEDALRMMRAFRFQSQLSFDMEEHTFSAICKHAHLLEKIAVERVQVEFIKMMSATNKMKGFYSFVSSGCGKHLPVFSEEDFQLIARYFSEHEPLAHFQLTNSIEVWTVLFFILGTETTHIRSHLRKWKESNKVMNQTKKLVTGLQFRKQSAWSRWAIYHLTKKEVLLIEKILSLCSFETDEKKAVSLWEDLSIHDKHEIQINGQEIMEITRKKSGIWLGNLLSDLEKKIVQGELENKKEVLSQYVLKKVH